MLELVHAFYAIFPFSFALYNANISRNIARSHIFLIFSADPK
jgi:hypothetical protein